MFEPVLIVARSGRQLAEAARAGGYEPLVVDFFGDLDTAAACRTNIVLRPRSNLGFDAASLLDALHRIRTHHGPMPLVWGSGFESQPHLLAALAQTWTIKGCTVNTLFAVNDPRRFNHTLTAMQLRPPQLASGEVPPNGQWLVKPRGSCGGFGVSTPGARRFTGQREYFQVKRTGVHLSAALMAAPRSVSVLGVCEALNLQPQAGQPYRFSGAIAAPVWFKRLRNELTQIAEKLHTAFTLRGLCGIDFVVDSSGRIALIELNARPTATFDLLAQPDRVFQAHMDADTQPYGLLAKHGQVRAMAVCYAEHPITVSKTLNWPSWVADRPQVGTRLATGMPACTISAAALTLQDTRRILESRFEKLINQLRTHECTR